MGVEVAPEDVVEEEPPVSLASLHPGEVAHSGEEAAWAAAVGEDDQML